MVDTSATGGFIAPSSPLPPEDKQLDEILQALVVGVNSLPPALVRRRWQPKPPPQPEPDTDWCAIGVVDEEPEFNISSSHDGAANGGRGQTTTYDNDIITVIASFYGPRARGHAKMLRTGLMISQNRETLYAAGIALVEMPGRLIFLPDLVNNQTVRRVDLSIRLRRHTELIWPILNLIRFAGTLETDVGQSVTLETPHSLSPLEE